MKFALTIKDESNRVLALVDDIPENVTIELDVGNKEVVFSTKVGSKIIKTKQNKYEKSN